MEALVALGLASNVVQFIDFSTKLISKSRELGNDAASADHKDHAAIATHLKVLADKVSASAQSIAQASSTVPPEEKVIDDSLTLFIIFPLLFSFSHFPMSISNSTLWSLNLRY